MKKFIPLPSFNILYFPLGEVIFWIWPGYRQRIDITNSGSAQTDYQVKDI